MITLNKSMNHDSWNPAEYLKLHFALLSVFTTAIVINVIIFIKVINVNNVIKVIVINVIFVIYVIIFNYCLHVLWASTVTANSSYCRIELWFSNCVEKIFEQFSLLLEFAIEITLNITYIGVVFSFIGSLSLDRYHFYFSMILKKALRFLSLSDWFYIMFICKTKLKPKLKEPIFFLRGNSDCMIMSIMLDLDLDL